MRSKSDKPLEPVVVRLEALEIMKTVLHDRPVVGLWGSDVRGGAQFAPGPLVVGAAAASIAVGFLTERV